MSGSTALRVASCVFPLNIWHSFLNVPSGKVANPTHAFNRMAGHGLRLLCLDGGGIRGLASLYVLKALLSKVGNPRPCHYFDMICGTSTGG